MAETKQEKRTFKWGDSEYLLDDLLKMHAEQENNFYNFARNRGQYDETALQGLESAVTNRINAVKSGQAFDGDGVLSTDKVDNISIQTQKKGLFKKDKYVDQDNTEWAKYYLNKLVSQLKPYQKEAAKTSGDWDINRHGFEAYLKGQGLNAQDLFENYDVRDINNPDAARSFVQRDDKLREHLGKYKIWLEGKGFDFTKNDNEWDDDYMSTLNSVINGDWTDRTALAASLRKLGSGNFATAFTSDRWDLSKSKEELDAETKAAKEAEAAKIKQGHLDEFEQLAYDNRRTSRPTYYKKYDGDFSMDWYGDLNKSQRNEWGTYLGRDNQAWRNAWVNLMTVLKSGSIYSDKNAGILLQGAFKSQPHAFIDLGDGKYLIRDSVTDYGQGTVYDPNSGYTDTVFLGDLAGNNSEILNIYRQLAYKYANNKYGTRYEDRPDVLQDGGELIPKHQYGNAVIFNWESSNKESIKEKAKENNVDPEVQKARDQYLDPDNKSVDNPNAGWDAKHYARLGSALVDLSAAVAGFVPGGGTVYAGIAGIGSTLTNFGIDMFDDAVTTGEMWKNLGLNLGMDVLGLIPGGGAASKMGKIVKTLKGTVPLIVALPGVASMLQNRPEIAASWKKAFDGDSDEGGSKMDYQDYMNILQVLNVAAGATNIARNTYQSAKKAPMQSDKVAVEVKIKDKKGNVGTQTKALVFEGEDAAKFKAANAEGKAQQFINEIEGGNQYVVTETTTSNRGKFWGRDANDKFHFFNQSPFGRTSTGKARVLNVRKETLTDFWGRPITTTKGNPRTRLYAETGKWEADLGRNKDDLIYAKKKTRLEDWKKQQQADVDAQFTTWRKKAATYKANTDQYAKIQAQINAKIQTQNRSIADTQASIEAKQRVIDDSGAEASRIQEWLDAGGVKTTQNSIKNARAKISRLEKSKAGKTPMEKKAINERISKLKAEIEVAKGELAANTPEAVLAAQEKAAMATTEQSSLQIELGKLQTMLDKLTGIKSKLGTRINTHGDAYNAIKDFKPIKKKFNEVEYIFDASKPELKTLENLFKQGGSINRNKINKFLNYAKG